MVRFLLDGVVTAVKFRLLFLLRFLLDGVVTAVILNFGCWLSFMIAL